MQAQIKQVITQYRTRHSIEILHFSDHTRICRPRDFRHPHCLCALSGEQESSLLRDHNASNEFTHTLTYLLTYSLTHTFTYTHTPSLPPLLTWYDRTRCCLFPGTPTRTPTRAAGRNTLHILSQPHYSHETKRNSIQSITVVV
jgi:hypothetical protein